VVGEDCLKGVSNPIYRQVDSIEHCLRIRAAHFKKKKSAIVVLHYGAELLHVDENNTL
jgi:hypothetical protein